MPPRAASGPRRLLDQLKSLPQETVNRYQSLSKRSKRIFWGLIALHVVIFAAIAIITPRRIAIWFNDVAMFIQSLGAWGVVICALMVVLSSHPPLFGFAGSLTLIGFAYGLWPGALISSLASTIGASLAFLSVRRFFKGIIKPNDKWDAFGHVMKAKGLPLVIMIRWCPLPWAVGNGLFASIESVKFWHFLVATITIQPRLLIPVFIGSRLTSLADPEATHDPLHFWLNVISIGLSGLFSVSTGYWIYRLTLEQMRKLDKSGGGHDGELAAEALEEGRLLGDFSDDEGEELDDEPLTERSRLQPVRGPNGTALQRRTSGSSTPED